MKLRNLIFTLFIVCNLCSCGTEEPSAIPDIKADTEAPVISSVVNQLYIYADDYSDQQILDTLSVTDNIDKNIADSVSLGFSNTESAENFSNLIPGSYLLKCTATDSSGNEDSIYLPVDLMAPELRNYQGIWVGSDGSFLTVKNASFGGGITEVLDAKTYSRTIESSTFTYSLVDNGISMHQYSKLLNVDQTITYQKVQNGDYPREAQDALNEIKQLAFENGLDDANCYVSVADSYHGSSWFYITVDSTKFSSLSNDEKLSVAIRLSHPFLDKILSNGNIYERTENTIFINGKELYTKPSTHSSIVPPINNLCLECNSPATRSYKNPFSGETENYCESHYKEIINLIGNMERDVSSSGNSKHICEECSKEGSHVYYSFTGAVEYYCTQHYEELKELLKELH